MTEALGDRSSEPNNEFIRSGNLGVPSAKQTTSFFVVIKNTTA
jgi:hypothetical protein